MINLFEYIKENKKLNTLLMCECNIYFYKQSQETNFSSNQETYSMRGICAGWQRWRVCLFEYIRLLSYNYKDLGEGL